jgi:hypothetical protein
MSSVIAVSRTVFAARVSAGLLLRLIGGHRD